MCIVHGTQTTDHMLYGLIAVYTFVFCTLLLMNSGFCRLVKIISVFLKDTAFISSMSYQRAKMQMDRLADR